MTEIFRHVSQVPFSPAEVFRWHNRPGAFARFNPPWEPLTLISVPPHLEEGTRLEFRVPLGPFRPRWVAEIRNVIPNEGFQDVQISGPFAFWEHTHRFLPVSSSGEMPPDSSQQAAADATTDDNEENGCKVQEEVHYRLPGGPLGRWVAGRMVRRKLERLFSYRHRILRDDLQAHARYSSGNRLKILISGSSGLIGSQLVPFLTSGGHEVHRLLRSPEKTGPDDVLWNPATSSVEAERLEGYDAVIHLAGENIGEKRWTSAQKERIRNSRVQGTRFLAETLAGLSQKPRVLVCASAIGYYGDRGEEWLEEESPSGKSFLPEVCREWEAAAEPARQAGIRVVQPRFGVVLSPLGGALQKMLLPFRFGMGGRIGNGRQYWSWIALDDVLGALLHLLQSEELTGPVNVVAPQPLTNAQFTKTLGKVLNRPAIFPLPAFAARLMLGEMADGLLLASARVMPKKLQATHYAFRFPELETALRHVLGRF